VRLVNDQDFERLFEKALEQQRPVVNSWIGGLRRWAGEQIRLGRSMEMVDKKLPERFKAMPGQRFENQLQQLMVISHLAGQSDFLDEARGELPPGS